MSKNNQKKLVKKYEGMRNLTIPQIQALVGTEFIYTWEGINDEIPAVIAAFDPKKGFTCLATKSTTNGGKVMPKDKNGEVCIIGLNVNHGNLMRDASIRCRIIRETGKYTSLQVTGGLASCALS